MKEALYYQKKDSKVQCLLCPKKCIISDGSVGFCGVRKNISGKLVSLVYARPCSICIDPIEKKPLFHFLPGSNSLSIGTVGCNLACKNCQNWQISRAKPGESPELERSPSQIVDEAINNDCQSISYTYTEPTVFYEFALDTAKIAKQRIIKNVIVSNGFINPQPLTELCKYIDAANIDLKAFNDKFYKDITCSELEPVLESLKILKKNKIWLEITNLIIPTLNDDFEEIEEMCKWISEKLGKDVPLHFSRFFPYYKLSKIPQTPAETLEKARDIALRYLKYVYIGNVVVEKAGNTYCPKCGKLLIGRTGFGVLVNKIKNNKCICGQEIAGVWE